MNHLRLPESGDGSGDMFGIGTLVGSIIDIAAGGPGKRYRVGMAQAKADQALAQAQVDVARIAAEAQIAEAKVAASKTVPTWALALGAGALVLVLTRRQ